MTSKPLVSFTKRGLPGLLLIALGLMLGLSLGRHSSWSVEVKPIVYPLALLLAVGGCNMIGSYIQQRPFRTMRTALLASTVLVVSLWLGSLTH
ncbi:hypothetical protein FNT36_07235 [Hymenobacter setariae]|uniref:Uncharacterized protein n=1 Tax=Hymenobacter setariae TaxID=2594794 RepID=A0A558BXL4_9BACT|nr:hypothetical protein [Hymenobacter setariae]TVT41245.1 hypothetical protein FNT36_07235 [Hymenobacter setariae]